MPFSLHYANRSLQIFNIFQLLYCNDVLYNINTFSRLVPTCYLNKAPVCLHSVTALGTSHYLITGVLTFSFTLYHSSLNSKMRRFLVICNFEITLFVLKLLPLFYKISITCRISMTFTTIIPKSRLDIRVSKFPHICSQSFRYHSFRDNFSFSGSCITIN